MKKPKNRQAEMLAINQLNISSSTFFKAIFLPVQTNRVFFPSFKKTTKVFKEN